MESKSPEQESKEKVLEEYDKLSNAMDEYGWNLDFEDKGDYLVIYVLMHSKKNPEKKLLAKLKCDDYPRQAPLLEFINPDAMGNPSLRDDVKREFYPSGQGIANDPAKSPMPIVCLPGHRIYHANGWHTAWVVPPPTAWQIYFFIDRLQTALNNDWS
jgi:hypothetical protein